MLHRSATIKKYLWPTINLHPRTVVYVWFGAWNTGLKSALEDWMTYGGVCVQCFAEAFDTAEVLDEHLSADGAPIRVLAMLLLVVVVRVGKVTEH